MTRGSGARSSRAHGPAMHTTSPRSFWSILRAYHHIGRLRARTGPLWIVFVRLGIPVASGIWFLLMPMPFTWPMAIVSLVALVVSLIGIQTFDVAMGRQRFMRSRPLVKLVDAEPVMAPMEALQHASFGVTEEELPLMQFVVHGDARMLVDMRRLYHVEPEEIARALRIRTKDVLALERGTKTTSKAEWNVVLRTLFRLGEEKPVVIDLGETS